MVGPGDFPIPSGLGGSPPRPTPAMEPIAIIGFALKFPQDADSEDGLWKVLMEKKCTMTEWPKDRLSIDAYHSLSRREKSSISGRGANFLKEDPILFDAPFFSITATEAASMDPQQRGLLETSYRALENAGIPMEALLGSNTGVYSGSMCDDYKLLLSQDLERMPKYSATGAAVSMLANRISWFYDLTGPSINLDSACSSSLMALDLACQGLRSGDTSMALVTGANLLLALDSSVSMSRMGFTSPDSRCYSFDERANGYARSEGFGVVVLKRLSDAVRDNDTIRSVIRSTGCNQDGHTPGITQPSKENQAKLIRATYEKAGLDPADTRYFEAHGTGTAIGDPIEAAAIGSVFHAYRSASDPLYVGALKSNLGHLEGASGIAGVIKATLVLENGVIPPNTNFEHLNPRIRADLLNLKFPTESVVWPSEGPRRASVNSFGFGGSNAHAVLDDAYSYLQAYGIEANHGTTAPSQLVRATLLSNGINGSNGVNGVNGTPSLVNGHTNGYTNSHSTLHSSKSQSRPKLLVWSAADENAVSRIVDDYARYHEEHSAEVSKDEKYLHHLAYTLSCRRTQFAWRSFAVAESFGSLKSLPQLISRPVRTTKEAGIIFAFTGQGAQYRTMGLQLLQYPVFRDTMMAFDNVLLQLGCEWSIFDESSGESGNIDKPEYSQPLCTALQVALIDLLRSFNIVPAAVIGHSSGEIAAAYAIGAISLASAARLSYHRGRVAGALLHSKSTGSMLAVGLSESAIQPYLTKYNRLSVACVNSPLNVTIAGEREQIASLKAALDANQVFCRELKTGVAYHSAQMQEVASEYGDAIQELEAGTPRSPSISMVSSVTGDFVSAAATLREPYYWVQNMVSPVRFSDALAKLVSRPKTRRKLGQKSHLDFQDIVEIGPHSALQRPIEEVLKHGKRQLRYTTAVSRFQPASNQVMTLAGRLYCSGYKILLDRVNNIDLTRPMENRSLTNVPLYSFSRTQRHWEESKLSESIRLRQHFPRTLLGAPVPDWNPLEAKWRRYLSIKDIPWLVDHRIDGTILLPATGMVALALEAAHQTAQAGQAIKGFLVREADFSNPIIIPAEEQDSAEVETYLRPNPSVQSGESAWSEVRICVRSGDRWTDACRAVVKVEYESTRAENDDANEELIRTQSVKERYQRVAIQCAKLVDRDGLYRTYHEMGLQYGPTFQNLHKVSWDEGNAARADVRLLCRNSASLESEADTFLIHPATLDAIAQLIFVPLTHGGTRVIQTSIPTRLRNAWFSNVDTRNTENAFWSAAATASINGFKKIKGSLAVLDASGNPVMSIEHMESNTVARNQNEADETVPNRLCFGLEMKPDADMLEPIQVAQAKLRDYLEILAHKNPALRILEIGTSAEAASSPILAPLISDHGQRTLHFSRYDYGGASQAMDQLREEFKDLHSSGYMDFLSLDLGRDLVEQGFTPGSYDAIVYADRPEELEERMNKVQQIRSLLKPSGKLFELQGEDSDEVKQSFVLGLSGVSRRKIEPTQIKTKADTPQRLVNGEGRVVQEMDLSPADVTKGTSHDATFLLSRATEDSIPPPADKIMIVVQPGHEKQQKWASLIQFNLINRGCPETHVVSLNALQEREALDTYRFIFLAETDGPFLSRMDDAQYSDLKTLLLHGKGLLWVTQELPDSDNWPEMQMVLGLARVLRSENPARPFVTLSIEEPKELKSVAKLITAVSLKCDSACFSPEHSEVEYVFRDGALQTRRVVESNEIDQHIRGQTAAQLKRRSIAEAGPLTLSVGSPGQLDSLRFVRDAMTAEPLAPHEVEIEVHAVGLNFKDLLTALGKVEDDRLGVECAGVVRRVGSSADFSIGDRVLALKVGCMKTHARCHMDTVTKIPESMSFDDAAAFPIVGTTAYYSLIEMGRLQRGESVLIHAGAGGTGQMCVQIAQLVGAEVYATVSSQHKRDLLKTKYGLQDDHIFYSRNTSFAEAIRRATNNRGVDVVVNSLGGDALVASWEVMAPFGRFIELGKADIIANSKLPMSSFAKNVSFVAVNIDYSIDHNTRLMKRLLEAVLVLVTQGNLHVPYPLQSYPFGEVEDAFRHMQSGKSAGKIVLTCQPTDVVQTYMVDTSTWEFPSNATYVIAGGLGGLGRSAARWMASKGAKNLVLLSRSGPTSDAAQALVNELQGIGVRVEAMKCDVSSAANVSEVLSQCATTMPPIRGCLQGTMVLRDALFENMTFSEWDTTMKSKAQASWNLHNFLPRKLDFFIMLSSLSGIAGTVGQANYAAGNTYQDALAHYRVRHGENAASLDLGVMGGVGVIAEKDEYAGHRDGIGGMLRVVEEKDFHAVLDYYCNPEKGAVQSSLQTQALFGLPTHRHIGAKSADPPALFQQPMFSLLPQLDLDPNESSQSSHGNGTGSVNYGSEFTSVQSDGEAEAVVVAGITAKLSRAISVPAQDIDTAKPLYLYGVDSLFAVELRNWIGKEFAANVAVFSLMGAPSILAVGRLVTESSTARKKT